MTEQPPDPERRLRQLLARHIEYRSSERTGGPSFEGAEALRWRRRFELLGLIRLWLEAGETWDQPDTFVKFERIMSNVEIDVPVPAEEDIAAIVQAIHEAARQLS